MKEFNRFDIPFTVTDTLNKALELGLINPADILAFGIRFGNDFGGMINEIVAFAYSNIHFNKDHEIIVPFADAYFAAKIAGTYDTPAVVEHTADTVVDEKTDFDDAFQSFFEGCEKINHDNSAIHFPNITPSVFSVNKGRRYKKVVRDGSVHCFVDTTNGDVLKAAGWNAPAKHARGNIFDDNNGLGAMNEYGPAYLR